MTISTQAILTNVVYGVPSGNYDGSSQDWASDGVKAANYYRGQGNIQTLAVQTTNFEGDIILEATLQMHKLPLGLLPRFMVTVQLRHSLTTKYSQ